MSKLNLVLNIAVTTRRLLYLCWVRTGEVMSPILFALFIEDLELYIQTNNCNGLSFQDISLILLLFADDMVFFGKSQEGVENSLNKLSKYCKKWGIKVNISKTNVMVRRRRGRLGREVWFLFANSPLDVVDNINNLGVNLKYTGSFTLNQQNLLGSGLRDMNTLLANVKIFDFIPKT